MKLNTEAPNERCDDYRSNSGDPNVCCNDDARSITSRAMRLSVFKLPRASATTSSWIVGGFSLHRVLLFKLASSYGGWASNSPGVMTLEPAKLDSSVCWAFTVSCDSDGDAMCPERLQYCLDDVCQPFDCEDQSDCSFSETCLVGDNPGLNRCVDCVGDDDCFGSDVCVNNICEECATDAHCFETSSNTREFYCVDNSCARCVTDEHCAVGFCGANNTCVECNDAACGDDVCVSGVA